MAILKNTVITQKKPEKFNTLKKWLQRLQIPYQYKNEQVVYQKERKEKRKTWRVNKINKNFLRSGKKSNL